jgi:adenine deaminase
MDLVIVRDLREAHLFAVLTTPQGAQRRRKKTKKKKKRRENVDEKEKPRKNV